MQILKELVELERSDKMPAHTRVEKKKTKRNKRKLGGMTNASAKKGQKLRKKQHKAGKA